MALAWAPCIMGSAPAQAASQLSLRDTGNLPGDQAAGGPAWPPHIKLTVMPEVVTSSRADPGARKQNPKFPAYMDPLAQIAMTTLLCEALRKHAHPALAGK
eukprot:CAMPEP_0204358052 /NCGR_PEP_ID=MMETSP0469-20131031/36240_1 /ASSEMBLY_ACC=CAM_ASM_000384 /TAXON_ID=2969 /ORGANISM="Oxyrrhis marina" /LENGTH=100 /DNA_ID=CAMNT_0051345855 /DNA_START=100 /DNA_END=401 /DNA_ORIENTATION=+